MGLNKGLTISISSFVSALLIYLHQAVQGYAFRTYQIYDAALHHEKFIVGFMLIGIIALTMRLGGSKAYEQYGAPIAAGFVLGYMVTLLVGGSLGLLRFFVPF
jgi:hypothetical protein